MTQTTEVTLRCPSCSTACRSTIHTSANVSRNPVLKQRVLSNTLNLVTCSRCGYKAPLASPLLYADTEKRLWIWLLQPDATGVLRIPPDSESTTKPMLGIGMRFRAVGSHADLVETIRIFDDGLDDRVVEMMKLQIEPYVSGYPEASSRLSYVGSKKDGERIHVHFELPQLPQATMTPEDDYRDYVRDYLPFFEPAPGGSHWFAVGREFAAEIDRRKQSGTWAPPKDLRESQAPSKKGNNNRPGLLGWLFGSRTK